MTQHLALDAHPDGTVGRPPHHVIDASGELLADIANPLFSGGNGSNASLRWGAANFETNVGEYTFRRALDEGVDLNSFMSIPPRYQIWGRAASFCMERSGYNEGGANEQGLVFFSQNMTFGQPPFYVHQMVAQTWLPLAAPVTVDCKQAGKQLSVSAQQSNDTAANNKTVVVRFVNHQPTAVDIEITATGAPGPVLQRITTLTSPTGAAAVNTPQQPFLVTPRALPVPAQGGSALTLPPESGSRGSLEFSEMVIFVRFYKGNT